MPTKKSVVSKVVVEKKKKTVSKKKPVVKKSIKKNARRKAPKTILKMDMPPKVEAPKANICHACHALPVGSAEMMALLVVMIFCLSAVLLTSAYAIRLQQNEIETLESQLSS